ncbi:MAG: hypothetical protein GX495_01740 [Chloroflexi bacterium]|nr:hypothetical protein [Chloroflexota bacterium]
MKKTKNPTWMIMLIAALCLIAAGAGLFWPADGQPYEITSHRGETVMINGRGLYRYDSVSSAAQMQANDAVTLTLGIPLLLLSARLAARGSLRGKLLLTGTLGFILYTYMSMSMLTAFNPLFLVYVALFSLSLVAFVLSMMSYDLAELPRHFSERTPRKAIAAMLFAAGAFLLMAWLGRVVTPLLQGTPPLLENYSTMVIQAMDLGLIVPLTFLSAALLLRRSAWGYLLASVSVMKFLTLGIAVSAMAINMARSGVAISPVELGMFPAITLMNLILAGLLLSSIQTPRSGLQPA